jgi:pantoate--beta-alanine ligase
MIIFKKAADLQVFLEDKQAITGFVPTMGALHKGHISLISTSTEANACTVCSIFVNPVQFNDPKDYEKYPVTIEKDILMLEQAGCNVLFLPSVNEIYPQGVEQLKKYELGYLETVLEGKYRPGHFQGVCMVMDRLLEIVSCSNLYLGQKDYQQCMVITKLVELKGLLSSLNVNICPTLREKDGLAMSSRNMRLNEVERKKAVIIYEALEYLKRNCAPGNPDNLKLTAEKMLLENGFKPDYIEIADAENLSEIKNWNGKTKIVALIAAFLNEVRLIDNMVLN